MQWPLNWLGNKMAPPPESSSSIVAETSFWILIKEWFLNKRKIQFVHFVKLHRIESLNENVKIFDWAKENLIGRWHIRIYIIPIYFSEPTSIIAKFNRNEDAMAFKLRWM